MSFDNLKYVTVQVEEGVATITLNRPDRFNAYTSDVGIELFGAIKTLDADDGVRAIIITGAGKHFCAGADLESGGDTFARNAFAEATELEHQIRPWKLVTPIIVAINGAAVGIGATLPLQWDIRIASEDAKIGFVFTRRGIVPEANSTWYLSRLVGLSKAMDFLLTGRFIQAEEALACGLVSRVVPRDKLLDTAREVAQDLATNTAPVSIAITKRLLWRQLSETDPARGKELEDELFQWAGAQPDAAEGVKAFLEKRDAKWSMSATRDLPKVLDET